MFKSVCIFMLFTSLAFSREKLEFQLQKIGNKDIGILVTLGSESNLDEYTIKSGDTLSRIALKLNVSVKELIKLNNIRDKNTIITGKKLKYINKEKRNEI